MKSVKEILVPVITLLVICAVATALLAFTNEATKDIISEQERTAEIENQKALLPGASDFEARKITLDGVEYEYSAAYGTDGELLGFTFVTSANGYGGEIRIITAVYPDGSIAGLSILSISETPGLGMKADDENYLAQYRGKKGPVGLSEGGNSVDAITGATITSRAVNNAVNLALEIYSSLD